MLFVDVVDGAAGVVETIAVVALLGVAPGVKYCGANAPTTGVCNPIPEYEGPETGADAAVSPYDGYRDPWNPPPLKGLGPVGDMAVDVGAFPELGGGGIVDPPEAPTCPYFSCNFLSDELE